MPQFGAGGQNVGQPRIYFFFTFIFLVWKYSTDYRSLYRHVVCCVPVSYKANELETS